MKKICLPISFIFISVISFAQSAVKFGVKAGVSSADMRGDAVQSLNSVLDFAKDYVTSGSRTAFFTGAYVNLPLGNVISVEPGLYYAQKGYKLTAGVGIKSMNLVHAKAQLQLNYVELPLLLKANFGGLQIFAGPQLSYLTNAKIKGGVGALGFDIYSGKVPVTSQFNRWDTGLTGGIGYQFNNGINITASYDYGLSKVDANNNFDAYNRMMKIGVGLNF